MSVHYPGFVGFDRMLNALESASVLKTKQQTYPPYNIVKLSEDDYQIEVALAGFKQSEVEVTVDKSVIYVTGKTSEDTREFIHKGIAGREFERTFTLADTIEVVDAVMENGILVIRLKNIVPESKKPRRIMIGQREIPSGTMLTD